MKNSLTFIVAIFCLYFTQKKAIAQEKISKYPQDYFRNPLDIPILLAGNFGECRPGHFHSGLDIKTEGIENHAVHAAADGYVSRMKIEKGGFGHALYITHPNGFTTLYAHLNDFNPELQKFLRKKQYEKQSWMVDINLAPDQFPVKKGEQIAWSGNTGGSTAPHLHFEIRDTKTEHPLNGALFGLDIKDTQPPLPTAIAIYNLNNGFYEQTPTYYKLVKKGTVYTVQEPVIFEGAKAGIAISVNDFMNDSRNTLNFYKAVWYLDDSIQGKITLDDIGYDVTRYVNAYADYKTKTIKNDWYQCMFQMPGNRLSVYENLNKEKGGLLLTEGVHTVKIELTDAFDNMTIVDFKMTATHETLTATCEKKWLFDQSEKLNASNNLQVSLGDHVLYDNVCAVTAKKDDMKEYSARYKILESYIPAHEYFTVKIKPNKPVPFAQRNKIALIYNDGKTESGKVATQENGWYAAKVRDFGTYYLTTDMTAPTIQNLQKTNDLTKAANIRFAVKEETTSIKEFRAELDGKWILFEPFGGVYVYKFDEYCAKGKHELVVKVKDENDNERIMNWEFVR